MRHKPRQLDLFKCDRDEYFAAFIVAWIVAFVLVGALVAESVSDFYWWFA